MRIVAFLTDPASVRDILVHLGETTALQRIAPARGPPLWDLSDAGAVDFDPHAQPAPGCAFDQRIAWKPRPPTARRVRCRQVRAFGRRHAT